MLRPGDTIEYLADVSSPPSQKGIRGQTKVIDRDISMWTAKFLLRGGKIRPFDPASPLQLEEKEPEKGPVGPAEKPGPESVTGTKAKKERRTETNGRGKIHSETDQAGDPGPKKPDPKRGTGNRRS
ncbi:MAG: hypothetical protein ACETVZ_00130 [Phycisphaerae bacterium]